MKNITKKEINQKLETLVNTETDSIANRWLTADEFSKLQMIKKIVSKI